MHIAGPQRQSVPGKLLFTIGLCLLFSLPVFAQNDNCSNATLIPLLRGGYDPGPSTSAITDLSASTIQAGESFAPVNAAAGQTAKSVWYKFILPTTRAVRITLSQKGTGIPAGAAGFTVYKTASCLPGAADISTKLAPVANFGATNNGCVESGTYLVQVTGAAMANDSVYLLVETYASPGAAYDYPATASPFGTLTEGVNTLTFAVQCQSIEDSTEACRSLYNYRQYTKSTLHVFTTPAYFDYILLFLSHENGTGNQTFGYSILKGDIRTSAVSPVIGCDSIETTGTASGYRAFTCQQLQPNTVYTLEIFYKDDFNDNVQLSLLTGGSVHAPNEESPEPVTSVVTNMGTLNTSSTGMGNTQFGYHGCNNRHSQHPCDPALPAAGVYNAGNGLTYNLSSFYTFTLTDVTYLTFSSGTQGCRAPLLFRLYKQDVSDNCNTLNTNNIISEFVQSNPLINCLQPGNYTLQVMGTDALNIANPYNFGSLTNTSALPCLMSNLGKRFNFQLFARTTPPPRFMNANTCSGKPYILPSGTRADTAGLYTDTIRTVNGCDSIIQVIRLNVLQPKILSDTFLLCAGQSYTLPWNNALVGPGIYSDTVRAITGCDSIVTKLTLIEAKSRIDTIPVNLCPGQSYTLPWGGSVSSPGEYRDTIRYSIGCDSLIRIVRLTMNPAPLVTIDTAICEGKSYLLSSGLSLNTPGSYLDTLRSTGGCDSLIRDIRLRVQMVSRLPDTVHLCPGKSYPLPWGGSATTAGIYRDTLRYNSGCDSVIREITLVLLPNSDSVLLSATTICKGQTYSLPWGGVADTTGRYRDTLKNVYGCDSLIRIVDLTVTQVTRKNLNASVCTGGSYTLPWGPVVTTANTYIDTVRTAAGCDSLIYTVILGVNTVASRVDSFSICPGGSLSLPWGDVVTIPGTYIDTLRHETGGCDSLVWKAVVSANSPPTISMDTAICTGQSLVLPSGRVVSTASIYPDTVRSTAGCDSVIFRVNLSVKTTSTLTKNESIPTGGTYTLPDGSMVNTAGTYKGTVRYRNGCDSLYYNITLTLTTTQLQNTTASVCYGQSYTLPWGIVVTLPGTYRDTLKGISGNDSLIRIVNLAMQQSRIQTTMVSLCSGQTFTLSWGLTVNKSGRYSDTLRYASGCDSLVRQVDITMTSVTKQTVNASFCEGSTYVLPWGPTVTTGGMYSDTLRAMGSCDSVIRIVNLSTAAAPTGSLSKSNDIDCSKTSAQLTAPAGGSYKWWPATGLTNTSIYNPVASPAASTVYHVEASFANGCVVHDSILVAVNNTGTNAYLVPNAFTPGRDGRNDCFGIKHWGPVSELSFFIYNRWGGLVFQTADPSKCWDGTYKNADLPTGSFVYIIRATTLCGPVERKGTVTLIR